MTFAIWNRLSQRFRPKPRDSQEATAPLDLSVDQVAALRELSSTPHWRAYSALLENLLAREAMSLFQGLSHERYLHQSGIVAGIRLILDLPDRVLQKVRELDDHRNARSRVSAHQSDPSGSTDATFFGTPWWDGYVRDRIARERTGAS